MVISFQKIRQSNFINIVWFTIKQYLFWMLFFQLLRLIFLIYNWNSIGESSMDEVLKAFWYAIYLDNSTAGYIMMLPIILSVIKSLFSGNFFNQIIRAYHFFAIFLATATSIGELPLYDEWKVKLNFKAISYLSRPKEVFQTGSVSDLVFGLLAIVLIMTFAIWMFNKFVYPKTKQKRNFAASFVHLALIPVTFIWCIRGGLQPIPIHQADVYYSQNNFLNLVAVNTQWNLISSIDKNHHFKNENPFVYHSFKEAQQQVDSLYTVSKDTTVHILNQPKPNIVIILLESWSADLIKSLGGYDSLAPEFEKLASQGVLFTQVYGSGTLSDQGIAAVLSGQPALPEVIVVNQPDKFVKLPSLSTDLKKQGYFTSFMYGGQLSYGNIKAFIYSKHFDEVTEGKDFPSTIPQGRLGVHDEFMLSAFADKLNSYKQPFFSMAFTMSSHSPYDEPFKEKFHWGGESQKYINAAYYTDSCLGMFFRKVKNMPFYKNTLFVLVSDHSHNSPRKWNPFQKEYRHVVMLLYGDAILSSFKGTKVEKISSQTDLAATLMAQLNLPHSQYKWSKDIFNPYAKPFCYYAFDVGLGWVTEKNYFAYVHDHQLFQFYHFENAADSVVQIKAGKSYLQMLFQEYLNF